MAKVGVRGRALLRGIHFLFAGIWVGGGLSLFILQSLHGMALSGDELYGMNMSMKLVDDFIVIPGAVGSLLSGLLLSWLTPWGFFKHRWIVVKLMANVAAIIFGTFWLGPWVNGQVAISDAERAHALLNLTYLHYEKMNSIFGAVQIAVIIAMLFISTLKPWMKKK